MSEATKISDRQLVALARDELKKLPGCQPAIRLKAIIASRKYPVQQVAGIFEVSPRTIFRWVDKFKTEGLDGLQDKPKGHLPARLEDNHKKQIMKWVTTGKDASRKKVRWTLNKLQEELEKVFGLRISITALWNHLEKMDLKLKP